jgi:hypothetical protein
MMWTTYDGAPLPRKRLFARRPPLAGFPGLGCPGSGQAGLLLRRHTAGAAIGRIPVDRIGDWVV